MVLFLQFGMLTLRCDHIEECNKTLIFHLSIEDLSLSPGLPILKSHNQMSQMKSKSTTQRTPQNVMCILGIQLHLMRKCKLIFLQHWQFGDTGWSKETVDCNSLLTDPKLPKSVITQWFLESLYREVLVFWCFKNARCVEFCLSEIFQYKTLLHHTRPEHSYAPSKEPKP